MTRKITLSEWQHIKGGETVSTGFGEQRIAAPAEAGTYTMYELVDSCNCHRGFLFEKET